MSKTIRAIIKRGLRLSGVYDPNEEPDANQAAQGLEAFQALLGTFPGRGIGGRLYDVEITSSQTTSDTAADFERLVMRHTAACTIYLPASPQDGARIGVIDPTRVFATYNVTVLRNGWLLQGAATNITLSTNGDEREWFFRGDLGDWKRLDATAIAALDPDDEHPYPAEFDDAMDNMLAVAVAAEYGRQPPAFVVAAADRGESLMKARYAPKFTPRTDDAVRYLPGDIGRRGMRGTRA